MIVSFRSMVAVSVAYLISMYLNGIKVNLYGLQVYSWLLGYHSTSEERSIDPNKYISIYCHRLPADTMTL